ncbi:MAG: SRPBCC domain-containing protein [Myxococcota bacterium]
MSVKKSPDGRRWVQSEVEVPGTVEEVWRAIASGPGISAWFVATTFEPSDEAPERLLCDFGQGLAETARVKEWDPPRRFLAEGSWGEGAPPVATEWTVEARDGGTCVVRVVHSLFASTDDWDDQLEGTEGGWARFFLTLKLYLRHFAGQPAVFDQRMLPLSDSLDATWAALTAELGLAEGPWEGPAGLGRGVVEAVVPHGAFLRLDEGHLVQLELMEMGGQGFVAWRQYSYGGATDEGAWQGWITSRFGTAS